MKKEVIALAIGCCLPFPALSENPVDTLAYLKEYGTDWTEVRRAPVSIDPSTVVELVLDTEVMGIMASSDPCSIYAGTPSDPLLSVSIILGLPDSLMQKAGTTGFSFSGGPRSKDGPAMFYELGRLEGEIFQPAISVTGLNPSWQYSELGSYVGDSSGDWGFRQAVALGTSPPQREGRLAIRAETGEVFAFEPFRTSQPYYAPWKQCLGSPSS